MLGAKILALGVTLITCVSGALYPNGQIPPGQVIGYRTTNPEQAARWLKAGTVTPDPNKNSYQIGKGQYTSPRAGDWFGPQGYKYCIITADPRKWAFANKAWIPHFWNGRDLWNSESSLQAQDEYLQSVGMDPAKTFRLSQIAGDEEKLQMVIPNARTNAEDGGMNLKVECKDSVDDFEDNKPELDYYNWPNVHGTPQRLPCQNTQNPPTE